MNRYATQPPTTPAEVKAATQAAKEIEAQGFAVGSVFITQVGDTPFAFAFSFKSAPNTMGHPAAESRVEVA
jgi:hypothetical protein